MSVAHAKRVFENRILKLRKRLYGFDFIVIDHGEFRGMGGRDQVPFD